MSAKGWIENTHIPSCKGMHMVECSDKCIELRAEALADLIALSARVEEAEDALRQAIYRKDNPYAAGHAYFAKFKKGANDENGEHDSNSQCHQGGLRD